MYLTKLALSNFRNYQHLELELTPGITLLHGNNAQGKTNLLESVFYLATARSPHAGAERELIRWGASSEPIPFARVEAQASRRRDERVELEIVLVLAREGSGPASGVGGAFGPAPKARGPGADSEGSGQNRAGDESAGLSNRVSKRIKVNGVNKRALDLLGQLNVVLFLPEDLDLVFGSPSDRRRYLDTTLSQIDSRYGRSLSQYNQVLEQRNALLRDFRERRFNAAELDSWDRKLVELGSYIIARRAQAVADYNLLVGEIHPRLTEKREQLRIVYQPTVSLDAPVRPTQLALGLESNLALLDAVREHFKQQLEENRPRERGAAMTLIGPHRDDLRFFIDHVDMITYASRGQGRTIALSLKMAERELMRAETGEEPILLLDDVMSELDRPRREALSEFIQNASQALVSCTDLEDFTPALVSQARVMRVNEGRLEGNGRPPLQMETAPVDEIPLSDIRTMEAELPAQESPAPEMPATEMPAPEMPSVEVPADEPGEEFYTA